MHPSADAGNRGGCTGICGETAGSVIRPQARWESVPVGPVVGLAALMRVGENDHLVVDDDVLDVVPEPGDASRTYRRHARPSPVKPPSVRGFEDAGDRCFHSIRKPITPPSRCSSRNRTASRSSVCAAGCSRHRQITEHAPPAQRGLRRDLRDRRPAQSRRS